MLILKRHRFKTCQDDYYYYKKRRNLRTWPELYTRICWRGPTDGTCELLTRRRVRLGRVGSTYGYIFIAGGVRGAAICNRSRPIKLPIGKNDCQWNGKKEELIGG